MPFKKTVKYIHWCWHSICVILLNKKHAQRDAASIFFLIIFLGLILGVDKYATTHKIKTVAIEAPAVPQESHITEQEAVQKEEIDVSVIQSHIDASSWTSYQNIWYGFSLKYPPAWADPVTKKLVSGDMWEQKIEFRLSEIKENDLFEGFDVEVYNISKIKEVSKTDEFPKLKNAELATDDRCANISGHLLETGNYPAEEVYIPATDDCYNAALFFTNTRGNYIYTIAPKLKEGAGLAGDPAEEIATHMPEFFLVAESWNLIDIQRPRPALPHLVSATPIPLSYNIVNGQMVCAKKNDRPAKSSKHKGRHLDMECCLDPDEYLNPHCYYPKDKYGKYL